MSARCSAAVLSHGRDKQSAHSRRVGAVGALQLKAEQQREASNEGAHMASPLSDYKPLEIFRAITLGSVLHPWLY